MTEPFIPLPGSDRAAIADAVRTGPLDRARRMSATIVLRRRAELPAELLRSGDPIDRTTLADTYGADPVDIDLVRRVLAGYEIGVPFADAASRRLLVDGTATAFERAFRTSVEEVESTDLGGVRVRHLHRTGELAVPAELAGVVTAVLGIDERPQARAQFHLAADDDPATTSYTPPQLGRAYAFPDGTDGSGQALAIIELGGGYSDQDLDTYFSGLGIDRPRVTAVGVDGGANKPSGDPSGADGEVLLDIEVAGALAPKASILVYFAPNTDQGFVDAVSTAVHADPTPAAVSISWGQAEDQWTQQARTAFDDALADAAALGVTVCVAAGDGGSSDRVSDGEPHVDFPAASPHALACGGTRLTASAGTSGGTETVWNDGSGKGATGGGVSTAFALPDWQSGAGVPQRPGGGTGRGVPDVAGDADPATGYEVLVDGKRSVIGGTSAVAPLWAALICRLAQGTGKRLGLVQTALYRGVAAGQAATGFHDVTQGSNGAYSAGPGWDPCTGLGSPNGAQLLTRLTDGD